MNRLLGIKKRCVAGLAALFVIMITMVSVNASYEWCELMLDDAGVVTEEEAVEIGNRLSANAKTYGIEMQENGTTILLWRLLGALICFVGSFVGSYILIKNINAICASYNREHGLQ